ncbi:MAG TPA: FAD-dependent oxidoreductase [Fastidiosipila sp.]|nr:FAD-dependent oxidoreductase [Fastidiosipila sp.]
MMYDLIVIGAGPAGLAAAITAAKNGLKKILIAERDREAGGILNQCIHNGFGLHYFKEELTGPEYASRFIRMLADLNIELMLNAMVLEITPERHVHVINRDVGYKVLEAKSIVLAMGCRERTRGAIAIPGSRPAGVLTAGAAQRYVNMEGYMVGRRVLVLGSGDIGLIMARRLTLEGAEVLACLEIMPYSSGLMRNVVQCLDDYDIPLLLSHTIVEIRGDKRVEEAVVARVDQNLKPIAGTEMTFTCDTILLSVGLIPENELTDKAGIEIDPRTKGAIVRENMETSCHGIFACGNVVHVHDLVDFVTEESEIAGRGAAEFVLNEKSETADEMTLLCGDGVSYVVPQIVRRERVAKTQTVYFRVNRLFDKSRVVIRSGENEIAAFKRPYMAPGEMEHVKIPKALLDKAEGAIVISVEEDVS